MNADTLVRRLAAAAARRGAPTSGTAWPVAAVSVLLWAAPAALAAPRVITLTQVACQFLESEGNTNRGYTTHAKADCDAINAKSAAARAAAARPLQLRAGAYVFRVTNRDVPYELGFWLRGATLVSRVKLPSVSGGGLALGKTQDYAITLEPGEYVYSCPLNTTPDYRLVVTR